MSWRWHEKCGANSLSSFFEEEEDDDDDDDDDARRDDYVNVYGSYSYYYGVLVLG